MLDPYVYQVTVRLPNIEPFPQSQKPPSKSNHSLLKSMHSLLYLISPHCEKSLDPSPRNAPCHAPRPVRVSSGWGLCVRSNLIWRCCNSIPIFPFSLSNSPFPPQTGPQRTESAYCTVEVEGGINLQGGAGPELDLHCTARTGRDGMGCGAGVVEWVGKPQGQGSGVDGAMNVRPGRWQGDGREGRAGHGMVGNDRERRKGRAAHPVCAARPAVETGRAGELFMVWAWGCVGLLACLHVFSTNERTDGNHSPSSAAPG